MQKPRDYADGLVRLVISRALRSRSFLLRGARVGDRNFRSHCYAKSNGTESKEIRYGLFRAEHIPTHLRTRHYCRLAIPFGSLLDGRLRSISCRDLHHCSHRSNRNGDHNHHGDPGIQATPC